jgi:SAM-dependent methyltransferase
VPDTTVPAINVTEPMEPIPDSVAALSKTRDELARCIEEMSACLGQLNGWLRALHAQSETNSAPVKSAASVISKIAAHESDLQRINAEVLSARATLDTLSGQHARASLDSFYLSFEDRFRGERSEIKDRMAFYLPFIRNAKAGAEDRPVLDLGCGRGEWLELLKEEKLSGRGVDLNAAMVSECAAHGLNIERRDVLEYLRSLEAGSQGAITGFHIVEHLPFEILMNLFSEAHRVLKPGGVAIFESPNCKNIMVGACHFYVDPTHRNPLFPETVEFMLGSHGFENIQIEYLTPVEEVNFNDSTPELATIRNLLFGPQDFGIIAYKPDGMTG